MKTVDNGAAGIFSKKKRKEVIVEPESLTADAISPVNTAESATNLNFQSISLHGEPYIPFSSSHTTIDMHSERLSERTSEGAGSLPSLDSPARLFAPGSNPRQSQMNPATSRTSREPQAQLRLSTLGQPEQEIQHIRQSWCGWLWELFKSIGNDKWFTDHYNLVKLKEDDLI